MVRLTSFRVGTRLVVCFLAIGLIAANARGVPPTHIYQGPNWDSNKRDEFYRLDQGSRIMPISWFMALKQPNGSSFVADSLGRYGYLPNGAGGANLPIGFTTAGNPGNETIGMNCAACHTRQIEVDGTTYRIDGGPAIVDFQGLLADLDNAVGTVLTDATAFAAFANAVLGATHTPADEAILHKAVSDWYYRFHLWVDKSLPQNPWGPGRLDAIAMIFNRLTGLDIGPTAPHVIVDNIKVADAPTRYPFLWNAAKQDKTQWPGFAPNENEGFRLIRNVGQVLGVFADFLPAKDASRPEGIDYWAVNSTNIEGLLRLETLTAAIGPPRWPWALDETLADRGKAIFERECGKGCHEEQPGREPGTWLTPIIPIADLKTDSRELVLLNRKAASGVLGGARFPFDIERPLEQEDTALRILKNSVTGLLVNAPETGGDGDRFNRKISSDQSRRSFTNISPGGYEARVLQGVWAAAPYLHNGSVPTLKDLLMPSAQRPASFEVGSAYDTKMVGLARDQSQFNFTLTTTDCNEPETGNSRCGHEYGTELEPHEKDALLEYLKKL